jgi:hypothetical protein
MSEGFTLDWTHGGSKVSSWVEGAPDTSIWTGVRLSGREQRSISTWRCGRCSFLEQYALGDPGKAKARQKQQHVLLLVFLLFSTMLLALVLSIKLA